MKMMRHLALTKWAASLLVAAVFLQSHRARAATLTVTSLADSGLGTLRAALASSANGDTIDATGVSGTILLTSGELVVTNSITILGPGPANLAINGNHASRAFYIGRAVVNLLRVSITNGLAGGAGPPDDWGGGIYMGGPDGGSPSLTVSNCSLSGNSATYGGGIYVQSYFPNTLIVINSTLSGNSATYGGGVCNDGASVWVTNCTFSGNTASDGGGIFNTGSPFEFALLMIDNSTFSSNSASGSGFYDGGGAIYDQAYGNDADVLIRNCTFNGNAASAGSAIYGRSVDSVAYCSLGSTILNTGTRGVSIAGDPGWVVSGGYNLSSDGGGGYLNRPTDLINTDPLLGPLRDNGGPTWTHALLPGSPAIDKGTNLAASATDQRGQPRTYDNPGVPNATGGGGTDIGAFEFIPPALAVAPNFGNVVLSWSTNAPGFTPESTAAPLNSGNAWTTVPGTPLVIGNQYLLGDGPVTGIRFYRLRVPW